MMFCLLHIVYFAIVKKDGLGRKERCISGSNNAEIEIRKFLKIFMLPLSMGSVLQPVASYTSNRESSAYFCQQNDPSLVLHKQNLFSNKVFITNKFLFMSLQ